MLQLQSWNAAATAWSVEMLLTAVYRLCTLEDGDAVRDASKHAEASCALRRTLTRALTVAWLVDSGARASRS